MADKDDRGDPPNDESAADENQAAGEEGAIAEDGPEKTEKSSSRPKSGPATIAKFTYTEHADTVSRTAVSFPLYVDFLLSFGRLPPERELTVRGREIIESKYFLPIVLGRN